jgi:hypothetical protein
MVVVRGGGGGGVGIYLGFDFDVVEGLDVVVGVVGEAYADVRFAATFCNILLSECVKGIFIVAGAVVFAMTDFVADFWPFCTTFFSIRCVSLLVEDLDRGIRGGVRS